MSGHSLQAPRLRTAFPAGTVLGNRVTGGYVQVLEHTPERVVGELLAAPGGAVSGPHRHPRQTERFEVLDGTMGYRRGDVRGVPSPGVAGARRHGAPLGTLRGRSVTTDEVLRAAVVDPESWPLAVEARGGGPVGMRA